MGPERKAMAEAKLYAEWYAIDSERYTVYECKGNLGGKLGNVWLEGNKNETIVDIDDRPIKQKDSNRGRCDPVEHELLGDSEGRLGKSSTQPCNCMTSFTKR
jgi:hypothetical protein